MKCRTNFPNSSPKGTLPFPHSSPPHLRSSKTPPLISNRRARRELIPLTQIRPSVLIYWLHFVGLFDVMLRGWVRRGRFQLLVLIGWNRPDLPWVFSYFACFLPSWYGWGYWGICLIFWGFFLSILWWFNARRSRMIRDFHPLFFFLVYYLLEIFCLLNYLLFKDLRVFNKILVFLSSIAFSCV